MRSMPGELNDLHLRLGSPWNEPAKAAPDFHYSVKGLVREGVTIKPKTQRLASTGALSGEPA